MRICIKKYIFKECLNKEKVWYVTTIHIYQVVTGGREILKQNKGLLPASSRGWLLPWLGRLAAGPALAHLGSDFSSPRLGFPSVKWEDDAYSSGLLWELMRRKIAKPWHLGSTQKSKLFLQSWIFI